MGCQEFNAVKLNAASSRGQKEAVTNWCPQNQTFSPQLSVPRGLFGTRSTGQVKIKGADFHCLFDTGSQVTTVTHFYNTYLSDHEIKPLNNLLEVEGANGQAVLYLRYVELNIKFPAEFLGQSFNVDTLALVVPDLRTSQPSVLIGTNTLDVVYTKQSNGPQTIVAGSTVVMDGFAVAPALQGEKAVIIQHSTFFSLPGGLMVKSCLIDLTPLLPCLLPVVISNESDHDVILPARAAITEVCAFQTILHK